MWWMPFVQQGAQQSGDLVANFFNRREAKKAWRRTTDYEQKVWDRETAYNTPAAQMERFKEAGLNPFAVATQGNPGNASPGRAMESKPFVEYRAAQVPDIMSAMQATIGLKQQEADIALKEKQLDVMDAQIFNLQESASLKGQQFFNVMSQTQKLQQELRFLEKMYPRQYDKIANELQLQGLDITAKEVENEILASKRNVQQGTEGYQIDTARYGADAARIGNEYTTVKVMNELVRNGLLNKDFQIRQEVLRSKRFENVLSEIEAKFMKDGDISAGQMIRMLAKIITQMSVQNFKPPGK